MAGRGGHCAGAQQMLLLKERQKRARGVLTASGGQGEGEANAGHDRDLLDWWSRSDEHADLLQFGFRRMGISARPCAVPAA